MSDREDEEKEDQFNDEHAAIPEPMSVGVVLKRQHQSLPANSNKAKRRTSLLDLMGIKPELSNGDVNASPTSPKSPHSPNGGGGGNGKIVPPSPRSPRRQQQQRPGMGEKRMSDLSQTSASKMMMEQVGMGLTKLTNAIDRRRSSIMQRIGISTGSHSSMSVEEMLKEAEKHRPVSAPVPKSLAQTRILTPEEAAWEERWTLDEVPYYYNTKTEAVTWEKPNALKTREELEQEAGDWTWIPHPQIVWQGARIVVKKPNGDTVCKTLQGGKTVTVPASAKMQDANTLGREMKVPLWPLAKSSLYILEDDLVALDDPNEALILHNLRARYVEGKIYTWVGASRSVLVSMNPYKTMKGLYARESILLQAEKSPNRPPPPHVFGIAADALESLLYDARDQAILISGESGAGKTEATKYCLRFLAAIAGSKSQVEARIVDANPVLEAFGNAKTLRNANSSRFGKWTEVNFDSKTRHISGGSITTYLLERSRVIYQAKGERNFHIFYQLVTNESFRQQFALGPAENFRFLNQSGCTTIENVSDESDLANVVRAMNEMGFLPEEQEWVMRTAAAVLHLGNIEFVPAQVAAPAGSASTALPGSKVSEKPRSNAGKRATVAPHVGMNGKKGGKAPSVPPPAPPVSSNGGGGGTGGEFTSARHLKEAAKLIGLEASDLEKALTYRSVKVREEVSTVSLPPAEAQNAAEAFAMALYSRLFEWIVGRVNLSLGGGGKGHFVGVLDIFGFEIFEKNSFEQLCINFANEKLQGQFNQSMFKEEEGLYQFEEIEYEPVAFQDNGPILSLIEGRPDGLLPQLDDEVKTPGGSDERWMSKMTKIHLEKSKGKFIRDAKKQMESDLYFQVAHYAGVVKYDAQGFVQANTDSLFEDLAILGNKSSDPTTKSLFPLDDEGKPLKYLAPVLVGDNNSANGMGGGGARKTITNKGASMVSMGGSARGRSKSSSSQAGGASGAQMERVMRVAGGRLGKTTVSQLFRDHLNELMELLETAESRYIRCVKPNATQSPDFFDSWLVLEQLTYSGVFEAVSIRRKGYPFRWTHKQFVFQYKLIHQFRKEPVKFRSRDDDYKGLAEEILAEQPGKAFRGVRVGKTRVLYRAQEHKLLLLLRNLSLQKLVPWLQARLRGFIARQCRRVMQACDDILQEAMDLENDMEAIENAIRECEEEKIGKNIPILFPGVVPPKMKAARKMIDDLKRFVALEERMDELENDTREPKSIYFDLKATLRECQALVEAGIVPTRRQERLMDQLERRIEGMIDEMRNELFAVIEARAKEALEALDRVKMRQVLTDLEKEKAEVGDRSSDVFDNVRAALTDMERLENEMKLGAEGIHKERMSAAVEEATKKYPASAFDQINPDAPMPRAKALLALPEIAFVRKELECATRQKDERRRVHREIRLKELELEEGGKKFTPIGACPLLKTPSDWAKAKFTARFFGKEKLAESMMRYTGGTIHAPLTTFGGDESATRRKNAKTVSKCIISYAGAGGAGANDEAARVVLQMGLEDPAMRPEILLQLAKHLTANSGADSKAKGEELLWMCLFTFPPGEALDNWLGMWLRTAFPDQAARRKFIAATHNAKYGHPARTSRPIADLRREREQTTYSKYELQPGHSSGPSEPDQVALQ